MHVIQFNVAINRLWCSMNNYGAILDDFGFEPTLDLLMRQYIAPFASFLYPHITGLDTHHGFVVSYELGKDTNVHLV